ncbi:flagellar hook-associated protein FlgL [bacterium]|nr:MAG: flagellar hook-associated protein FlgL [bacterium]
MRVTNNMMTANFLNNLNNNMREMDKIQTQLATGKRISKPSDDPVSTIYSLRLNSSITEAEKFLDNVASANAWLDITDTALGQAGDILQGVRDLTVRGASDTLSQASRDSIAKEVAQLREQLIQVANTSHDGRYIFGGFETTQPPFDVLGNYTGSAAGANLEYEIGISIKMTVNLTGDSVFKAPVDTIQLLTNIENDLLAGNTANLSTVRLGQLDQALDNIIAHRASVGAKVNRLEMTQSRLEEAKINFNELLSSAEDIDTAEVITQLKMQENVYRTALASGARIIQPTLLDFLR